MSHEKLLSSLRNRTSAAAFFIIFILATAAGAQFNSLPSGAQPTAFAVTNNSSASIYLNLSVGQPPATLPQTCSTYGQQFATVTDPALVFQSSVAGKTVSFTPTSNPAVAGYYQMAAGETITYQPQTFSCGSNATCSKSLQATFYFNDTTTVPANWGCASSALPNATTNVAMNVNLAINGSTGQGCGFADGAYVSAVSGINAILKVSTQGANGLPQPGWPAATSLAENGLFGENANRPGVYGWAASQCQGNRGYQNPTATCAAPQNAPLLPAGASSCQIPGTNPPITYPPIVFGKVSYCDERSQHGSPCWNSRANSVTGGTIRIHFHKWAY